MEKFTCMIIGFGKSGQRFFQAVQFIEEKHDLLKLEAICDINPNNQVNNGKINFYKDYKESLSVHKVDIIFVCVSENQHFEILKYIHDSSYNYKKIISEKPLTENLEEANIIEKLYNNEDITINFVERYSPIIEDFHTWIKERDMSPKRINCFWGKYRVFDKRMTIGTLSEISHPLDLVTNLCNLEPYSDYKILSSQYMKSDYYDPENLIPDTINANIKFKNGIFVNCNSSFIWNLRRREITLYLKPKNSEQVRYMAHLNFDDPVWDLDNIKIFDMHSNPGYPELVFEKKYTQEMFDEKIFRVNKIYKFILENIRFIRENKFKNLALLDQAIYIQSILEDIKVNSDIHEYKCFHKCDIL